MEDQSSMVIKTLTMSFGKNTSRLFIALAEESSTLEEYEWRARIVRRDLRNAATASLIAARQFVKEAE